MQEPQALSRKQARPRRKQMRRWIMLVNAPQRFARQFGSDDLPAVEQTARFYRTWLRGVGGLGKLGRGQYNREHVLELLLRKGRRGPVALLKAGERQRVNTEEGAIYKAAVLGQRAKERKKFKAAMSAAREVGILRLVPNPLEILRSRPVVCGLCTRVFVRPLAATAQKYCPACRRQYTPKQLWSRAYRTKS